MNNTKVNLATISIFSVLLAMIFLSPDRTDKNAGLRRALWNQLRAIDTEYFTNDPTELNAYLDSSFSPVELNYFVKTLNKRKVITFRPIAVRNRNGDVFIVMNPSFSRHRIDPVSKRPIDERIPLIAKGVKEVGLDSVPVLGKNGVILWYSSEGLSTIKQASHK